MDKKVAYGNQGETFVIKNYNQAKTFSNFFASIAGELGIPLWVFYVNRAQSICAFGLKDKDHSFLEFQPANKAYQTVHHTGFRTFLKLHTGTYYEPFREDARYRGVDCTQTMYINAQDLKLEEENKTYGLKISVEYSLIVEEPFPGLVRKVTIENTGRTPLPLTLLDGLSAVVPYPESNFFLKELACTIQAWALAEALKNNKGYVFRLKIDPADVPSTKFIEGGNLYTSVRYDNGRAKFLPLVVDPDAVFGEEKGFLVPQAYCRNNFSFPASQTREGKTLCAFTYARTTVAPRRPFTFYSLASSLESRALVGAVMEKIEHPAFFAQKFEASRRVVKRVKDKIFCLSGMERFDAYVAQSFLDNVLRGGMPLTMETPHRVYPHYIYSRKHGDLERDYNRFVLMPHYFSEGEANYRDINQNRRMDPWIFPHVDDENVLIFFNLQRIDGYNPLVFKGVRYAFKDHAPADFSRCIEGHIGSKKHAALKEFLTEPFSLGEVSRYLLTQGIAIKKKAWQEFFACLIDNSKRIEEAEFGEGYWIDHFTYNLDLLESYEAIFPDRVENLLFKKREFVFWDDAHTVKPRYRRYVLENGRVFQLNSLEISPHKKELIHKRKKEKYILRTHSGKVYKTTLAVKMLVLILNKLASLDPFGVGVEMEADKPGWCDSLNGLPALFGSSLPETAELKRLCVWLKKYCEQCPQAAQAISVPEEAAGFFRKMDEILKWYVSADAQRKDLIYWDKSNAVKEHFREITFSSLKDREETLSGTAVALFLERAVRKLDRAFKKARVPQSALYNTYFINAVKKYRVSAYGFIIPEAFRQRALPLYLEAQARMLKIEEKRQGAKQLYAAVKRSPLYDRPLGMYRLNASLKNESFSIGRSRVFPPGWLENESIWLHMEYKYFLGLLRQNLYKEFFAEFLRSGICFQNPEVYGRSIFENSSFIVSSAHADKKLWGRGFVARLSGSTAELVNMFLWLAVGIKPFYLEGNRLYLRFRPSLTKRFFTTHEEERTLYLGDALRRERFPGNTFAFKFLGDTLVVYHNPSRKDLSPHASLPYRIVLDGTTPIEGPVVPPEYARGVRENRFKRIDVYF